VVGQALATTNEMDLLRMISIVHTELGKLIDEHAGIEYAPDIPNDFTPVIELGEHRIEAVKFID
jgi:hypothetical protein